MEKVKCYVYHRTDTKGISLRGALGALALRVTKGAPKKKKKERGRERKRKKGKEKRKREDKKEK